MTTKIYINTITIFIILLTVYSCDSVKKPAVGLEDKIFVIADSIEFERLRPALESTFEKLIYTPQPEKIFSIERRNVESLNSIKNQKNIIIIAPLGSGSKTSDFIEGMLDSTVEEKVLNDKNFVFNKYDLWAGNQLVMILTSPTIEQLEMNILSDEDNLIYHFQKISNKRLYASLYNEKYEKKDVEAKMLKDYGFMVYVQADFQLALNKPEDNFIWLRRSPNSDMERWLFIHWIEDASPEFLHPDSIANERNRITEKFYRTSDDLSYVEISDYMKTTREVNFLGRYAIMTQGLWRFSDQGGGGPFINYTFYDENTKRIYMLDGSIFAPKYMKKSLIQQIDVLLQSFRTEYELDKDRKEDILEYYNK